MTDPAYLTKARALASHLHTAGHYPRDIHTVTDTTALPVCVWCADDGHHCPAGISIYHPASVVETCAHCVLTAAAVAADTADSPDFMVEVTQLAGAV